MSLPSYTYQCALKYTDIKVQTLQDKDLILLIENIIQGGISSVIDDRGVRSDENKKILYMDATKLYGHIMSQHLPYHEFKFEKDNCLGQILNTSDDNEVGCSLKVDLKYPEKLKEKTKNFPFCPENRKIDPDK